MSGSLGLAADAAGAAAATEELLADCLRLLGPDHPHTLTARGNLAYWRGEAGDAAGAAAAYLELLADRLRVLGPGHRDTLAWDARRIDLAIDAQHRPGEGTVLQELRELARRVSEGWEQQRLANEAGHTTRPNCLRFFKRQESQGEQIFRLGLEPIAAKVRQSRDVRALLSDSPPAATWRRPPPTGR